MRCSGETPCARSPRGARASSSRRAWRTPSPGCSVVGAVHVAVARDLRDHRGGGDRRARGVAADHRALLVAEVAGPGSRRSGRRTGHARRARARRAAPRGWSRAGRARRSRARSARRSPPRRGAHDHREELLARLGVCCLESLSAASARTLATAPSALEVEQHRRGDERAGEAAPPGLVGAGDEAGAERAIEVEEPASRWRRLRGRAARLRRPPRLRGVPMRLGGPVGGEGAADDPLLGDGAPEPAVVGLATVVAHHEVVAGRNRDRLAEVAAAVRRGRAR